MNKSLFFVLLPLVACNTAGERAESGECPVGETCSPATPHGLHFLGDSFADQLFIDGPSPTAIGGTQNVLLEYDDGDGIGPRIPLDLPYRADDDGGLGVEVVTQAGASVTVRGVKSRSNYLRIVDPDTGELFDRYTLTGAAIEQIEVVGTRLEDVPAGAAVVWAAGHQELGVALEGEVQVGSDNELRRIVDTSMRIDLVNATRTGWDTIAFDAAPGMRSLGVTAGDHATMQLPFEVVAEADAVTLQGGAATVQPHSTRNLCFAATNAGRYVYGLEWQFEVNGAAETHGFDTLQRNCIVLDAQHLATGTFHVTASAGGQHLAVDVPVAEAIAPARASRQPHRAIPTAGDRAAL